jgi:hypothetical protein
MSPANGKHGSIGSIEAEVKNAGQKAAFSPLMEALTRVGYGVRGLIYITMGLLALNVTLGRSGARTDQQSAIAAIGRQPAGIVLLWLVLVGLVSYSLWGVIRAVFDPLHKGKDLKGLVTRAAFLFSAAAYAILTLPTYRLIRGAGRAAPNGAQTHHSLASIMSEPWGPWAIGLVGVVVIAFGLYEVYQGFKNSFDTQLKTYAMTAQQAKAATQLGRFGTAARGFVFALVGGALCHAAYESNSSRPIGIDAALTALKQKPYGVWLLGVIAVGLVAFGVYSMLSAAWFRARR